MAHAKRQQRREMERINDRLVADVKRTGGLSAQETVTALNMAAQMGYDMGINEQDANRTTALVMYAAIAHAAHEAFGFGKERIQRLLKAVDAAAMYGIDTPEDIEAELARWEVEVDMDDPLERVHPVRWRNAPEMKGVNIRRKP